MSVESNLTAALSYASQGYAVFPLHTIAGNGCSCGTTCASPGKHPRTVHGVKDATTDQIQIRAWWQSSPDDNIGIATGNISGLIVLDVDGDEGEGSLSSLELKHGKLPNTLVARTGSGGRHLYFSLQAGQVIHCSAGRIGIGLDVRGEGGYVVAPPSRHSSGGGYEWQEQCGPVPIPDWLIALMHTRPEQKPASHNGSGKIPQGQRNAALTSLAGTMRRRGMASEAIEAALQTENKASCDPPLAEQEVRRIATSVGRYQPAQNPGTNVALAEEATYEEASLWPDPSHFDELPPVPVLELDLLPDSLRPLVEDVSERMQAPPEYAAAATIVSLAGCVGRRAAIQPKVHDNWRVIPNLWGAIIAPPGFMKSPMLHAITLPLTQIEANWREKYKLEMTDYKVQEEQVEIRHQAWKEDYKRSIKKGEVPPAERNQELSEPTQRRLLLTDATFEKLHEILAQNPAGVLVVRDELTGWLA